MNDSARPVDEIIVLIKLCDSSSSAEKYDTTRYGKMTARDRYWELIHQAKDDSILNMAPHIIHVELYQPEHSLVHEDFICKCQKLRELANA